MRRTVLPALLGLTALGLSACADTGTGAAAGSGGPVTVDAGDSSCDVSRTELSPGTNILSIINAGSSTTEVYLYGEGGRIVAEKENIGPGLSHDLTVQVSPGSYTVACKPGQVGDGIRTPVTVTAADGAAPRQSR